MRSIIPSVLLCEVFHAESASKKTAKDYRRLKKYDILVTGRSSTKLIRPMKSNENSEMSSIKCFVHYGKVFDILHSKQNRGVNGVEQLRETRVGLLPVCSPRLNA